MGAKAALVISLAGQANAPRRQVHAIFVSITGPDLVVRLGSLYHPPFFFFLNREAMIVWRARRQ